MLNIYLATLPTRCGVYGLGLICICTVLYDIFIAATHRGHIRFNSALKRCIGRCFITYVLVMKRPKINGSTWRERHIALGLMLRFTKCVCRVLQALLLNVHVEKGALCSCCCSPDRFVWTLGFRTAAMYSLTLTVFEYCTALLPEQSHGS